MSTYAQWQKSPSLKRVTCIYGPDIKLVDKALFQARQIVNAPALNTSIFWAEKSIKEIWERIYQNPLIDDKNSLVVVRNSQNIEDFSPIESFLTTLKTELSSSYVIFVSDRELESTLLTSRLCKPILCKLGRKEDFIAEVCRSSGVGESVARHILDLTAGDMQETLKICEKLSFLDNSKDITSDDIDLLEREIPSDFVDALVCLDLKRAIVSSQLISPTEVVGVLRLLKYKIDRIHLLRLEIGRSADLRKISSAPGFSYPEVKELLPLLKFYPSIKISQRRVLLAKMESSALEGISEGVLEALTALW